MEPLALAAEQVLDRDARLRERQLGGVLGVLADLLQVAPTLEALGAALEDEQRDVAVAVLMPAFPVLTATITRSALMPLVMNVFEPSTT